MNNQRVIGIVCFGFASLAACGAQPGYKPDAPGQIVCGCHDANTCYDGAAQTASTKGENEESAETLMYYSQCACFQGSRAGCNTLGHFIKDWISACEAGDDPKKSCTIAGVIYEHGAQVPQRAGRSIDRDPAAAKAVFKRGCEAGSAIACRRNTSAP